MSDDYRVTEFELKLIHRLERLAKTWPDGYMLASMGGSLCLFRQDDRMLEGDHMGGLDADKQLWSDGGRIPNTGGDW